MGFGNRKPEAVAVGAGRLASIAGSSSTQTVAGLAETPKPKPASLEPDPSRIRPRQIEETPEARKRRLAAKTINFTATILARLVIIGAAGFYMWSEYQLTRQVHRGIMFGVFAMVGDLGRVILKASEPGTK
ncbi:MAG: hypothetical protein AAGD92_12940 [Pseudomonadota bacterium]